MERRLRKTHSRPNLFEIHYEAAQQAKPQEFSVSEEFAQRADADSTFSRQGD